MFLQPTFLRTGDAITEQNTTSAENTPRYRTTGGISGLTVMEGTTNLFSANVAGLTTDLTGFTPYNCGAGALTRDTGASYWVLGSAAIKCITPNAVSNEGFYTNSITVNASQTYTCSVWLCGTGNVQIILRETTAAEAQVGVTTKAVSLTATPTRYSVTRTFGGTGVKIRFRIETTSKQAATIYASGLQAEQKSVMTDWHTGSATARNNESLTIPTSNGTFSPSEGTIEMLVNVTAAMKATNANHYIWNEYPVEAAYNNMYLVHTTTGNAFAFAIVTDAGTNQTVSVSDASITLGWHRFACKWSATEMKMFIDGTSVGTPIENPTLPLSIKATLNIGSKADGALIGDADYSDIMISRIARTDAQLATRGVTTPLPCDNHTTFYAPLTSALTNNPFTGIGGVTIGYDLYYPLNGQLKIQRMVGRSSAGLPCNFSLYNSSLLDVDFGEPVQVYLNGVIEWSGYTDSVDIDPTDGSSNNGASYQITCRDMAYLAQKRISNNIDYEETTAELIARELVDDLLTNEGVSYTTASIVDTHCYTIPDGELNQTIVYFDGDPLQDVVDEANVTQASYTSKTCAEIMDDLCDRLNYWWKIDENKTLWFAPRAQTAAPWTITQADVLNGASYSKSGERYRNRQRLVNTMGIKENISEVFIGDGQNQTYTVQYPLYHKPKIYLSGNEEDPDTIGIQGVDSDKPWYWSKATNIISHDIATTPIPEGMQVRIVYDGTYTQDITVSDNTDIAARAAVEGNSGIIECTENINKAMTATAATDYATRLLTTYMAPTRVLDFTTRRAGLREGMTAHVELPKLGIDQDMFIVSVQTQHKTTTPTGNEYRYKVQAITGPQSLAWTQIL